MDVSGNGLQASGPCAGRGFGANERGWFPAQAHIAGGKMHQSDPCLRLILL